MRKLILLILCLPLVVSAQNTQISFMDIPMNKSVDAFYSILIKKGFKNSECGTYSGFEETKCCTGSWMSFNDCQIVVARNQGDKTLSRVMVKIGGCTSKSLLKIIEQYNQQFGEYSYETKGNGYVWKVDNGGIVVTDMTSFGSMVISFHNKSEFDQMLPDFIDLSQKEQNHHVKFRGIPMNDLNEMERDLISSGFVYVKSPNPTSRLYSGTFGGVEDCYITVLYTPITNKVAQIVVDYPTRNNWIDLKMDFLKAASSFSMKYGSPRDDMKMEFVRDDCEDNELRCLENDNGIVFFYGWDIQGGGATLKITPEKRVTLRYYDDANTDKYQIEKRKQAYDDY